jgi:hypothetical protein
LTHLFFATFAKNLGVFAVKNLFEHTPKKIPSKLWMDARRVGGLYL